MAFCKKCGTEMEEDARFCVSCGTPMSGTTGKGSSPEPEPSDGFKTQLRQKPVYGVVNLENLPEGHVVDDRYEVKEKIGQGGFGAVYRVFDRKMEIEKALKVLPEAVVSDREAMENIRKEATTMARLNHPNIVRVYDFQDQGPIKYIDMEYVDGKNLTDIKLDAPGKKLTEESVTRFAQQIAKGLAYAHEEKVIHRDIKPQNILVSQKSGVKIMDFGISETVRSSMSRMANSSSSGTLVYMSPEQLKGKDVGKEADIYSFGCLLYELVAGKTPFNKGDIAYQIINEKPERITGISDGLNDFLQKCLAKDYKNRYRNFGEVQKALELKQPEPVKPKVVEPPKVVPKPQPAQPVPPSPVPKKPNFSTKPQMMGLLVLLVLILGVLDVAYLAITSNSSKPQGIVASTRTEPVVKKGTLTVRTSPSSAGVKFINYPEDYKDDMPLDSGRYQIDVSAVGYKSEKKWVVIASGEHASIRVDLEKEVKKVEDARLTVRTTPSNAKVRILNIAPVYEDGITLSPGKYHISVSASGYEAQDQWVELKVGSNGVMEVALEKKKDKGRKTNSLGMEFVYIQPGSFMMGSPSSEQDRQTDETQHRVTLSRGYYMQTTEVTVGQWRRFISATNYQTEAETGGGAYIWTGSKFELKPGYYWDNPGFSQTDENPVTCVSWNDVNRYIEWLSRKEGVSYRLPTEAEWEYACRAGSETPYANGNNMDVMGWYSNNSGSKTHGVGQKKANAWGLYDMHGNVFEWCADWYGDYPSGSVIDPQGVSSGSDRVLRGGSWYYFAGYCRAADRISCIPGYRYYFFGFRLASSPGQQG